MGRHPRLVIAAPQGRSGKTTVSIGICAALAARGMAVQPFKKGPDYIDPSWLSEAAGRVCRSLDPFFFSDGRSPSPELLRKSFLRGAQGADISLVEGNHGLYDSSLDEEGAYSTAAVARAIGAPVVLVVNATRMTRSAAAVVHGCQTFEPDTWIAGVVLNNVANSHHEAGLRSAVERYCRIPVLGALPRDEKLTIPDRHLGLLPRSEARGSVSAIEACLAAAEKYIDLDAVIVIARSAGELVVLETLGEAPKAAAEPPPERVSIGVIRDRAFTFYYPENFEALEEAGADLVFIDSLTATQLPPVDALYIGGGFPEVFMEDLERNQNFRREIKTAIEGGLPVYAECGGLMYLSQRIRWGDRSAEMVGVLPFEVEMTARPQGHGYVLAEAETPGSGLMPAGTVVRGHEFHHSRLVNWDGNLPTAYRLVKGSGVGMKRDGLIYKNVLAAYTHLHAVGSPGWAPAFVERAKTLRRRQSSG